MGLFLTGLFLTLNVADHDRYQVLASALERCDCQGGSGVILGETGPANGVHDDGCTINTHT